MLLGCGTVVATSEKRSLVRVTREKCVGCPGTCRLFARKDPELWLEEKIPLGAKVEIETSPQSLVVGTLVTLGIPLAVTGLVFYLSSSWMVTVSAVALSFIVAIACCRTEKFRLLLVSRVRNVV